MHVYLSDLHLDSPEHPHFRTLARVLENESSHAHGIYLLGDICEVWVGDDDDGPLASALRDLLTRITAACPVYLMHGNRDFLFGQQFARDTGCRLLDDPHQVNESVLLSHGDALCIDDTEYQKVRKLFRSSTWQQDILARSL